MPGAMQALTSILPALQVGMGGAGIVGNLINSVQQGQQVKKMQTNENLTPQQLAAKVAGATQPLDQSLVNNVQNLVQADVAGRGLAESPGTFSATESQALAPFEQQNQQTALQLILTQLGMPAEVIAALTGKNPNMSSVFQMLSKGGTLPTSTPNQVPNPAGQTTTDANILSQIMQAQNTASTPGLTTPNNWTGDVPTGDGASA